MKLGNVIDMLSINETYCDLRDLTIGKRMFLLYGSASQVKRDPKRTFARWRSRRGDGLLYVYCPHLFFISLKFSPGIVQFSNTDKFHKFNE